VFWARSAGASDSAEGAFVFESASDAAKKSVHYRFECEREWRRFFVPFLAARDEPAGEAVIRFLAGYGPQVLEIAGLRVASYGTTLSFADFPFTPLAYRGRKPDSPWRVQAADSIDKERKAQLTIVVLNSKGKVVPWTPVRIHQLQHAYGFGVAVTPGAILDESEDGDAGRAAVMETFNFAEVNTGLDWGATMAARDAALDAAQWLGEYEMLARSHALFAADGQLPPDLAAFRATKPELRSRVLDHVREKVTAARGLITEWSVPIALAAEGELGVSLLGEVLRAAREADPQARLLVHAGNVLADGVDAAQQTAVVQAIRSLIQTKAPVQGIALGSHFGEQLLAPDKIWAVLDRFAELRLPLCITDFEVDTWDEGAQADYTRDFATTVFAHPATSSLSLAAFWAKTNPTPNAALYSADWSPRPTARAWQELMQKRWWSSGTVTTNGKGVAKIKAFHGYYAIEVRGGGKPKVIYAKLGKSGRWLQITMPSASAK
jgi:endo-1,4-beta-xylanase